MVLSVNQLGSAQIAIRSLALSFPTHTRILIHRMHMHMLHFADTADDNQALLNMIDVYCLEPAMDAHSEHDNVESAELIDEAIDTFSRKAESCDCSQGFQSIC